MILLKKKQSENFIEVEKEKEQDIQYTEDDVNFYNQHLDDNVFRIKNYGYKVLAVFMGMIIVSTFMIFYVEKPIISFLLSFIFNIISLIYMDMEYRSVDRKTKELKKIGNVDFNFHYFLQKKLIKKLEKNQKIVDERIVDKIVKLYPEKERVSIFFNEGYYNTSETISNSYRQYLNILENKKSKDYYI